MTLQYFDKSNEYLEVIEKLTTLSLAFKLEQVKSDAPLTLIDGNTSIAGLEEILKHLRQIEGELHKWYYCNC